MLKKAHLLVRFFLLRGGVIASKISSPSPTYLRGGGKQGTLASSLHSTKRPTHPTLPKKRTTKPTHRRRVFTALKAPITVSKSSFTLSRRKKHQERESWYQSVCGGGFGDSSTSYPVQCRNLCTAQQRHRPTRPIVTAARFFLWRRINVGTPPPDRVYKACPPLAVQGTSVQPKLQVALSARDETSSTNLGYVCDCSKGPKNAQRS